MSIHEFDVVVIGAGPVGENVADYAHRGGLSAAVVESELVGGECSYWACIPSKAMLRPVRAVRAAHEVAGARQGAAERADAAASLARRDAFVSGYDDSAQVQWLDGAGVTLVRGHARLGGERRVIVDTGDDRLELHARTAVVVCTGTEAFVPPIEGLAQAGPWTSREATGMREVPTRLAIIGGGVVACEMSTAAAELGAQQVTLLVRGQRLLEQLEPFASARVQEGLSAQGVDMRFSTSARRVERHGSTVALDLDDGSTLEAHEVLVATGRRPRTRDLGLETVGLTPGEALTTDATLAVTGAEGTRGSGMPWLFAAGDVNGRAPLTHHGKYQARLLGDHLASRGARARLVLHVFPVRPGRADTVGAVHRHRGHRGVRPGDLHRPAGRDRRPHRGPGTGAGDRRDVGGVRPGRGRRRLPPRRWLRRQGRDGGGSRSGGPRGRHPRRAGCR